MQEMYTNEIDRFYDDNTLKQKSEVGIMPNSPIKPIGIAVETKEKLANTVLESDVQKTPADQVPSMPGAEVPTNPVVTNPQVTTNATQAAAPVLDTPVQPAAPAVETPVAPAVETQAATQAPVAETTPVVEAPIQPVAPEIPAIETAVNPTQTAQTNPVVENVINQTPAVEAETVSAIDSIPAIETPTAQPTENAMDTIPALENLTDNTTEEVKAEPPVETMKTEELEDLSAKFVQPGPSEIPPAVQSDVITDSPLEDMASTKSLDEVTFSPTEPKEEPKPEEVAPVVEETVVEPPKMPDLPDPIAEGPSVNEEALFEIPKPDELPELGNDNNIPNLNNDNNIPNFEGLENPMKEEIKLDETPATKEPVEVVSNNVADTPFAEPAPQTNIGVDTLGSTIGSVLESPVEKAIEMPQTIQDSVLPEMKLEEKVLPDIETTKTTEVNPDTLDNIRKEMHDAIDDVFKKYRENINKETVNTFGDLPKFTGETVPEMNDEMPTFSDNTPLPTTTEETKIPDDIKQMMDNSSTFLGQPETPVQAIRGTKFI